MEHLVKNNIICTHQHGFRKHRSCDIQLLELVEDLNSDGEHEGGRQTEMYPYHGFCEGLR